MKIVKNIVRYALFEGLLEGRPMRPKPMRPEQSTMERPTSSKLRGVWVSGQGRGCAPAPDHPKACEVPQEVRWRHTAAASSSA